MRIEITSDLSAFDKVDARFANAAADGLRTFGQWWVAHFVKTQLSGRRENDGLNRRTGALARSWASSGVQRMEGGNGWTALTVQPEGPGSKYAALHEFGGIIRPVNAKHLWIPTEFNRTPAGVTRISPRQAIARGGFIAWDKGPTFFGVPLVKSQAKGMGPHIIPLFVLKKSVEIHARMGARATWLNSDEMLKLILTKRLKKVAGVA